MTTKEKILAAIQSLDDDASTEHAIDLIYGVRPNRIDIIDGLSRRATAG